MSTKRILIVSNKWWEADPLCSVLLSVRARPLHFTNFRFYRFPVLRPSGDPQPKPPDPEPQPRMIFDCNDARVEVWCLEDLVNPAESSSSSSEKARILPSVMTFGEPPSLVVPFGTAASREELNINGSVIIGRKIFIHDPRSSIADRAGLWSPPQQDLIVDSSFATGMLNRIAEQSRREAESRFLTCPLNRADPPIIVASDVLVSLGVVNIINPEDYVWADKQTIDAFVRNNCNAEIGSIETTHGVICSACQAPFLYVSGIPNTVALFDYEVRPRVYAQSFVASHNAAVALAWILPGLVAFL